MILHPERIWVNPLDNCISSGPWLNNMLLQTTVAVPLMLTTLQSRICSPSIAAVALAEKSRNTNKAANVSALNAFNFFILLLRVFVSD